MEIITLTEENLAKEHICCAMTGNSAETKKKWLKERFSEGLVFKKFNIRGKVFIEYIPSEFAWAPIKASNYMYINCLWVAGQFAGQGYAKALLQETIKDAKNKEKDGLLILSSDKKRAYISDKKFLLHEGFKVIDKANPYYELLSLTWNNKAGAAKFTEKAKTSTIDDKENIVIYYTNQCPFCEEYINKIIDYTTKENIPLKTIKYTSYTEAQKSTIPSTTYSVFKDGKFLTHEILTVDKLKKILTK